MRIFPVEVPLAFYASSGYTRTASFLAVMRRVLWRKKQNPWLRRGFAMFCFCPSLLPFFLSCIFWKAPPEQKKQRQEEVLFVPQGFFVSLPIRARKKNHMQLVLPAFIMIALIVLLVYLTYRERARKRLRAKKRHQFHDRV